MMSDKNNGYSGTSSLRPRARILRTLGDELISSEIVAVIELVKNAYDADATKVLILLQNSTSEKKSKIEIYDNGNGMSLQTIQDSWMEPATLSKKRAPRSKYKNRRVLGEKGIGRFATSRLADKLEVITREKNSNREIKVEFDWTQFDDPNLYLDQIEAIWMDGEPKEIKPESFFQHFWARLDGANDEAFEHGTILRMTDSRTTWNQFNLESLQTGLARLASPHNNEQFQVYLKTPDKYEELSGYIEPPEFLDNPHYYIKGHIEKDGTYNLEIKLRNQKNIKPIKGKFSIRQNSSTDVMEPICGAFDLDIRAWDRQDRDLIDLANLYGSTIDEIRSDLDKVSGVSIYRDGFRVLPYGEKDEDWLEQNLRRVQNPTLRFSNNQLSGFIFISADTNPDLKDQSNREGLVNNQAFSNLKELVKNTIAELETRRKKLRKAEKKESETKARSLFSGFSLKEVKDSIKNKHPEDKELLEYVTTKQKEIDEDVRKVQEVLSRYNRLATLGQLINVVLHDGRAPVATIVNVCNLGLLELQKNITPENLKLNTEKRFTSIKTAADILATVFRRIEPFSGRKRGRPSPLELEQIIEDAVLIFESEIKDLEIDIRLPDSKTLVTVDKSEIQQVIINLMQNSLYWLRSIPADERAICISVLRLSETSVEIQFSDSGPGVENEFREDIFEPYFSRKPDGVGLGLTISGEILSRYYDGTLELLDSGPLAGATFRITLSKRVRL